MAGGQGGSRVGWTPRWVKSWLEIRVGEGLGQDQGGSRVEWRSMRWVKTKVGQRLVGAQDGPRVGVEAKVGQRLSGGQGWSRLGEGQSGSRIGWRKGQGESSLGGVQGVTVGQGWLEIRVAQGLGQDQGGPRVARRSKPRWIKAWVGQGQGWTLQVE